ncbi:hypothetical protein SUGI_0564620 [Cryptomeria japonica]|uniref:20 kDa chaperonin, chloroplastic-like n=1 Tax=Cryptomeria japonica TaxID=3369 RepID=UPI002408C346|nr:20 kDa chaperonin, chloroplastic-like [Cryptomeria japonica]GLJ28651.1 hypothetical protein SUGI_0564620 [Cryptomeria japonica]
MATYHMGMASKLTLRSSKGLRPTLLAYGRPPCVHVKRVLTVRAIIVVAPKFSMVKPLCEHVLVEIKEAREKIEGGILVPSMSQNKLQGREVVDVGDDKIAGKEKLQVSVQISVEVVYSSYA